MNKKRIAQYCCAALVAAGIGLNIQNAIADYGIGENSLSLVAVGGSNSGSNSNSNSNLTNNPNVKSNFQRSVIWYTGSASVGFSWTPTKPEVNGKVTWKTAICCIEGTDMDHCDFSLESRICKMVVTRPAH